MRTTTEESKCPTCSSENIYADGSLWICPECGHEWSQFEAKESAPEQAEANVVKDAHGNALIDDGHDIACIIDGIGSMNLKSEFVKKV